MKISKLFKEIVAILMILVIISVFAKYSLGKNAHPETYHVPASEFDFSAFHNRTIKLIRYCKFCGTSGNHLIIEFTDGSKLVTYNYKYELQVVK